MHNHCIILWGEGGPVPSATTVTYLESYTYTTQAAHLRQISTTHCLMLTFHHIKHMELVAPSSTISIAIILHKLCPRLGRTTWGTIPTKNNQTIAISDHTTSWLLHGSRARVRCGQLGPVECSTRGVQLMEGVMPTRFIYSSKHIETLSRGRTSSGIDPWRWCSLHWLFPPALGIYVETLHSRQQWTLVLIEVSSSASTQEHLPSNGSGEGTPPRGGLRETCCHFQEPLDQPHPLF